MTHKVFPSVNELPTKAATKGTSTISEEVEFTGISENVRFVFVRKNSVAMSPRREESCVSEIR